MIPVDESIQVVIPAAGVTPFTPGTPIPPAKPGAPAKPSLPSFPLIDFQSEAFVGSPPDINT